MKAKELGKQINKLFPEKFKTDDFIQRTLKASEIIISGMSNELEFRVRVRKPQCRSAWKSIYLEMEQWYAKVTKEVEWLLKPEGFKFLWDKSVGETDPRLISDNLLDNQIPEDCFKG